MDFTLAIGEMRRFMCSPDISTIKPQGKVASAVLNTDEIQSLADLIYRLIK